MAGINPSEGHSGPAQVSDDLFKLRCQLRSSHRDQ